VCDIGCGLDVYFLNRIKRSIKKGVGLDQDLCDYTEGNLEFKNIKIDSNLPFPDDYFNAATMVAFLEHIESPEIITGEAFRILKKGGKLILTTPSPISKPILIFLAFLSLIDKRKISSHKNYFWPKDIRKILSGAGFNKENVKINFFEFFTNIVAVATK